MNQSKTIVLLAAMAVTAYAGCASDGPAALFVGEDGGSGGAEDVGDPTVDAGRDAASDGDAPPSACTDDGWCHAPAQATQNLETVWGDGTGVVWTVSREGNVLRWDGASWSVAFTDTAPLHAVWGSGPTDLWVGGDRGLFHGQGESSASLTWTRVPIDRDIPILSIWGTASDDVWAVGNRFVGQRDIADLLTDADTYSQLYSVDDWESTAVHYEGATVGWRAKELPVQTVSVKPSALGPLAIEKVTGISSSEVWLVGRYNMPCKLDATADCGGQQYESRLLRGRRDQTDTTTWIWSESPLRPRECTRCIVTAIGVAGPDSLWIAGRTSSTQDQFWHHVRSADGVSFESLNSGPVVDLNLNSVAWNHYAVWGTSRDDVYIAGERGRLRRWNGASWELPAISITDLPFHMTLRGIWGGKSDSAGQAGRDVWVVGDKGAAIHKVSW